jgi:DNA replication protein DnaC
MQTIDKLTANALTGISARSTKASPASTTVSSAIWAKWLGLRTFNDPQLEQLVTICTAFAKGIRDGLPGSALFAARPFWLSLLGRSGTGKTHCAHRLWTLRDKLDGWDRTKFTRKFIYWPEFVEEMRDRVRDGLGLNNLIDMGNWPLLVIDDIGAENDKTGFASEKLNMLLGMRVGKWTVLTSNLNLAGLSKVDDRISSRIVREPGNLFIELTTQDYGVRHKPAE